MAWHRQPPQSLDTMITIARAVNTAAVSVVAVTLIEAVANMLIGVERAPLHGVVEDFEER